MVRGGGVMGSRMNWGGMVRSGGGVVGSSLVFRIDSLSFVFHIGNITVLISLVRHNLHTAIRQVDTVFSSGVVVFTRFSLAESSARVGILHSISVGVDRGKKGALWVGSGGVVRGGVIWDGRSGGKGQKSCGEGDLEF